MATWSDWITHPIASLEDAVGLSSPAPRIWSEEELAQLSPEEQDRILNEPAPDVSTYTGATVLDRLFGTNVGGALTDPTRDYVQAHPVAASAVAGVGAASQAAGAAVESIAGVYRGVGRLVVGLGVIYVGSQLLRRRS